MADRQHYYDLIKEVQDRLINDYINNSTADADSAEALEIQKLLQALKAMRIMNTKTSGLKGYQGAATSGDGASLQAAIDAFGNYQLLTEIYEEVRKVTGNRRIFLARGNRIERGNELEQDLRDVLIATVRAAIEASAGQKGSIMRGMSAKNVTQVGAMTAQTANAGSTQQIAEMGDMTAKQALKVLEEVLGAKTSKRDAYTDRYGKVDVTGENMLQFVVKYSLKPEYAHLIDLLSRATFTAKNYASRTIQDLKEIKESGDWKNATWGDSTITELHLGDTVLDKALRSTLGSLGYSGEIVDRIIYGAATIIESGKDASTIQIITETFQQIRFIYELTGAGQSLKGFSNSTARFLVYNDPTGDPLYVISATQLIREALLGNNGLGKQRGKITIAKSVAASYGGG